MNKKTNQKSKTWEEKQKNKTKITKLGKKMEHN